MGFFREMFDLGKEFGQILSDGRKELTEIMTDGFKEMVIQGKSDYKTSFEKREEASGIISSARSRYNDTFKEVEAKIKQTEKLVEAHYAYKGEKYDKLKSDYAPTVKKYIARMEFERRERGANTATVVGTLFAASVASSALTMATRVNPVAFLGGVLLTDLISQRKRVREANEMLDEAREYRARIDAECEKLRKVKSNLTYIEMSVNEERKLIDRLLKPLELKMRETAKILGSKNPSQRELEEATQAIAIIQLLEQTLTTQFLQGNAEITRQYKDLTKRLVEMEQKLSQGRL
ncbi:hypothetical protein FE782_01815 [Paenibacillus antri]|uniref:Uncharacterized protein n=1 Tax=Paenibacillus antri TaxID=2582848 RepID=A0A5R9GHY2_9BACL|nr:hypothetical protein [Paenibacillus antri]TLS54106.1 hypothetical protein FE782_01815 [Paenibacillus antri]